MGLEIGTRSQSDARALHGLSPSLPVFLSPHLSISHPHSSQLPCVRECSVAKLWPTLCNPGRSQDFLPGFPRPEYWSRLPPPPPGDLPYPGIGSRQILYLCTTWEALPTSLLALKANLAPHPTILYSFAQIKGTTQTYKAPRSELQIPCRQKPVGFIWALGLHWPDQQWLGAESKGPQSTLLEGK